LGGRPSGDRLQVRIGIATGLVVVGDLIGEGEAQERGVVGETPNLAARLQALAEPGSVVIAPATRRLLGDRFRLRALGRHELKGLAEPVEPWAVAGVSASEGRFEAVRSGRLTGFVGREHELGLLMERWKLAQDGEGQVVLLSGEPGIGKSRILSELCWRLEAQQATSLRLHCSPYFVNSAFYPIIDNFERALRFARDDTGEQKLDKLEALIVGQYGRPREDLRFLAAMLSIPCDERYGAIAMTPQKFKDETLRALVDATEAIARRQPTVQLFEDIHWADPTTLEVVDLLIHRVRNIPLLVVLTHRPEFSSRWAHYGHVAALTLTKLTRSQGGAMVSRLAGGKELPADLLDQILDKTDGVPLFVEELTKSILESGNLRDAGDRWEYAGRASTLAIPLTLRDSLMARLDRFAPVKEVAQIGAAIGREFSYELIAAVAARPELDQALAQLTASGLAFQQGTPPDAVYTFKHALVQDAAYDSLLKARRQGLHGKIARVIEERRPNVEDSEPELLAHHYTEAKQPGKAIPLWRKAGGLALNRLALAEAIAHLNRGLKLVATLLASAQRDGEELDLRTLLGTAFMALKGWAAQELWDSLHPALALANSLRRNDALVSILWGLYTHVLCRGRVAESMRWVTELINAAETYGDADFLIVAKLAAAATHFWLGDPIKAREGADRVLALYDEERHNHLGGILIVDPKTYSLIFSAHSTWILGYPEHAVRILDATHDHARRRGHPFNLGFALVFGGAQVFDYLREPGEVLNCTEEADRVCRENSLPFVTEYFVTISSGVVLIRKGQAAEGMALIESGLAVWEDARGQLRNPYCKSVLAEGLALTGNLDRALDLIDEVIAQIERPGWEERIHYAEALRIKGWMLSLNGDPAGAERAYIASLDWARTQRAKSWELRTATSYARLMRDQSRAREAHDLLAPIYGWFTEGFATKDLKDAKALLEELA
jgi:hypothetical protein